MLMTVVLFLYNKKNYDFNFLLRCITDKDHVFFAEFLSNGPLRCFLEQWGRYDNFLPLAIRRSRILTLKTYKRAITSFIFLKDLG